MSKVKMFVFVALGYCVLSLSANAAVTAFNPEPINLQDLPHQYYFTWGINFEIPEGEVITGATLTFYDIYDYMKESNDTLYVHLLDNPAAGVRAIKEYDSQGGGDNFANQGILLGAWNDPRGGSSRNFNLIFDLAEMQLLDELTDYISTQANSNQSNFGVGIDPDCHYYNKKVEFVITTTPIVPAPAAVSLGSIGVLLVGWLRMRKTLK